MIVCNLLIKLILNKDNDVGSTQKPIYYLTLTVLKSLFSFSFVRRAVVFKYLREFEVMTGEGSVDDNVFDMEVNGSSRRLTPVVTEQRSATTPSPTGYRDYKPPAEVLSNSYGTTFHASGDFDRARANFKRDQEKEEDFAHKTILLGDSGVGKTSLLVQFDTGNFQPGNFAATVGIGFTDAHEVGRTTLLRGTSICRGDIGGPLDKYIDIGAQKSSMTGHHLTSMQVRQWLNQELYS